MTEPRRAARDKAVVRRWLTGALIAASAILAALEAAPVTARQLIADGRSLPEGRAPAADGQAWRSFKLRGRLVAFHRFAARDLVVSKGCLGAGGAPDCDASRAVTRATLRRVQESAPPYRAGRDVCILLGGEPEVGEADDGAQSDFCLFRDGSWIDSGSLLHHAVENDKLSRGR